ncbi:MAG TPA: amino acid-binding ACT domain-containing protein [Opitutaceae bacterium]|jgi:hypothetical protein|nr:amino acid-binding ACT domain-containing protein [Opitutaceae bacterium]
MHDLHILLEDAPGALARLGETLGAAGVSIEGGGAWLAGGQGHAHFLVADRDVPAARAALATAGLAVPADREAVVLRLRQDEPGQLGKLCRRMADAHVNIEVLYSDHANQLILVPSDLATARGVAQEWMRERTP